MLVSRREAVPPTLIVALDASKTSWRPPPMKSPSEKTVAEVVVDAPAVPARQLRAAAVSAVILGHP
jgi:hypothetical protein